MADIRELLDRLWQDYTALNPQARAIGERLRARGEAVVNDHLALRTYTAPRLGIESLAASFVRAGYVAKGEYVFPDKKLHARHYESADASLPKVFISELDLARCSVRLRASVDRLINQMPSDLPRRWDFCASGRPWRLRFSDYEALRVESEYAAWVAAFGFRANHFTVDVNALKTFATLQELNAFLKREGFVLNTSDGEIKGSPGVFLEQSSTLAGEVEVDFADGRHRIPGCYYEFAKRYPLPDGTLFQGFHERSADKIFESTDRAGR